jgi:hypothetical protein
VLYAAARLEVAKDNEVQRALKARDAANTDDVERWTTLQAGSCVKPSTAPPLPRVRVRVKPSKLRDTKTRRGLRRFA